MREGCICWDSFEGSGGEWGTGILRGLFVGVVGCSFDWFLGGFVCFKVICCLV